MIMRGVIICFCMLPVLAGLAGIGFPAFGWFPPLGRDQFSLAPLSMLFDQPGIWHSMRLSLFTAVISTFLSYWLAMMLLAYLYDTRRSGWVFRFISPLLSVPHITVAVGILFLLQPSGWLFRLISPWLTGWDRPPDLNLAPDLYGYSLILGLIAKELPFLLLMGISALSQIEVRALRDRASVLGYGPISGWIHVVQPQLSARMRMPVFIVMIFAVSVVDMAIVLAPSIPAPLAVRILEWFWDPDLSFQFIAAMAAVLQLFLALLCCVIWFVFGAVIMLVLRGATHRGFRFTMPSLLARSARLVILILSIIPCLFSLLGLLTIIIWSFANVWRFPSVLPDVWGMRGWGQASGDLVAAGINSVVLGLFAAALSVVIAILWLENKKGKRWEGMIYVPLLLPQASFLFGLQMLLIWLRLDGAFLTLLWAHSLFVFPYVMLSLGAAWRRYDNRYTDMAASLGVGAFRRFFQIKLPMLMIPVLTAFSIGFAVSSALYLPTVFASNGRYATLTTEAVTLAASASRQSLGVASVMQMILPLVIFIGCDLYIRFWGTRFRYFRR
jgi:putative thiamine transport system permease protein